MSVFDVDESGGVYQKGYVISTDDSFSGRDIFISNIDEESIIVGVYYSFLYAGPEVIDKIIKIGLIEGKNVKFKIDTRLGLGDTGEVDFHGLIVENQKKIEFLHACRESLTIKNLVLKGPGSTSRTYLDCAHSYTLENVYIENHQISCSPIIIFKNSQVSCDIFKISYRVSGHGIRKLIENGDFKSAKERLNLPLDCVKFNKIKFGKKSLTREQYENL